MGLDKEHSHSLLQYAIIDKQKKPKNSDLPSKVCYSLSNAEEDSWPSQLQHAMNKELVCQTCSLAVLLPRLEKFSTIYTRPQKVLYTSLHVAANIHDKFRFISVNGDEIYIYKLVFKDLG